MARRNATGYYLLEGLSPQQIADRMGLTLSTVRQYLCTLVGEGEILRADIAFAIDVAERQLIEEAIGSCGDVTPGPYMKFQKVTSIYDAIPRERRRQISRDLIELYLVTRDPRSDLYALICEVEILLHRLVKQTLEAAYGDRWWREGIPEPTRKQCQIRKEEDRTPLDEPYRYTTFIDMKSIIENNWRVFSVALPKMLAANKPDTLQTLQRVAGTRNQVMHPVKEISEYESDYRFARKFLADLDQSNWRIEKVVPEVSVA